MSVSAEYGHSLGAVDGVLNKILIFLQRPLDGGLETVSRIKHTFFEQHSSTALQDFDSYATAAGWWVRCSLSAPTHTTRVLCAGFANMI